MRTREDAKVQARGRVGDAKCGDGGVRARAEQDGQPGPKDFLLTRPP